MSGLSGVGCVEWAEWNGLSGAEWATWNSHTNIARGATSSEEVRLRRIVCSDVRNIPQEAGAAGHVRQLELLDARQPEYVAWLMRRRRVYNFYLLTCEVPKQWTVAAVDDAATFQQEFHSLVGEVKAMRCACIDSADSSYGRTSENISVHSGSLWDTQMNGQPWLAPVSTTKVSGR